jgi:23S rRNA pseudouridine2605 synthase
MPQQGKPSPLAPAMQPNPEAAEGEGSAKGPMRLQRYLAACGLASRRNAEALIESGCVEVNGVIAKLGDTVDPEKDAVTCEGRHVQREAPVYIVLNKPKGTVASARDPQERKTVLDCVPGISARVFPVGRLDYDVEGALLLTNDGELAHRLMHPRYEVDKVYLASVWGEVSRATLAQFEKGIALDDGPTAPAKATVVSKRPDTTLLRLTLHEGKKREVKRMCAAAGHPVRELQRVSIAGINVKGLRPGEWRYLTHHEIAVLRKLTGLSPEPMACE